MFDLIVVFHLLVPFSSET